MTRGLPLRLAALLAAFFVVAGGPAFAQESPAPSSAPSPSASPSPSSKLDSARAKLREDNGDLLALLKKGDELKGVIDGALRQLAIQLRKAEDRLAESKIAQEKAKEAVRLKTIEQKAAIAALAHQKDVLNERATSLYITGPQGYLPAVLGARDINDAVAAAEYGRRALEYEADAVIGFRAAWAKVRRQTIELGIRKRALDAQVRAAAEEAKALAELQRRQWQIRNSLFSKMGANVAELSKILGKDNPFGAIIASYSNAGAGFTEVINEAQAGERQGRFVDNWMKRPVAGPISSPYGYRIHPIYGYVSFHTGIDISSDTGTPIHAAQAGTVIDAGYFGAFGNTILIDHGSHIATVYAHLDRILVSPGQRVKLATVLGTIGSTGWSTGPHLHFEVRLNGKPQEPSHWL